jgi:hypothetical protein
MHCISKRLDIRVATGITWAAILLGAPGATDWPVAIPVPSLETIKAGV